MSHSLHPFLVERQLSATFITFFYATLIWPEVDRRGCQFDFQVLTIIKVLWNSFCAEGNFSCSDFWTCKIFFMMNPDIIFSLWNFMLYLSEALEHCLLFYWKPVMLSFSVVFVRVLNLFSLMFALTFNCFLICFSLPSQCFH